VDFGWLQSWHTFSFAQYRDPRQMGFGPLRVINEDRLAAGAGFGRHPDRDMEILSWVLSGTLEHKDSLGTGTQIHPGELQRMTAGTGVIHSEFNASCREQLHLLRIWIVPDRRGLTPEYEQSNFVPADLADQWRLIASGTPCNGAVKIHQDVNLYVARLSATCELTHIPQGGRKVWLQVARGGVEADGETLAAGDAAAWTHAEPIRVLSKQDSEVLLFDMAA
jgi:redox-sensitive bicupin YhaK (pirin superfamily)